jgi:hypothetical protein
VPCTRRRRPARVPLGQFVESGIPQTARGSKGHGRPASTGRESGRDRGVPRGDRDIGRCSNSRRLVAYLGLDPKVRQSGEQPARSGRITKRGSASARWALVEAAWSLVNEPGPLRAYYRRIRARRGHGKAIVAAARKPAVLFWCLLHRGEDYAHQQPSLTAH